MLSSYLVLQQRFLFKPFLSFHPSCLLLITLPVPPFLYNPFRITLLMLWLPRKSCAAQPPNSRLYVLQGPTWTLRCWSPARLRKTCLCIIGSLWTGDHRFVSRFPSCSYMETSSLGRKLLSSSESAPCELYCYIIIILNSF